VKRVQPAGFDLSAYPLIRIVLRNPRGAELTGETTLEYAGTVPAAHLSAAVTAGQLPAYRSAEGLLVGLSGPSTQPVSVSFEIASASGVQTHGTLVFLPGELSKQLAVPTPEAGSAGILHVTLSNPTNASLAGFTDIYYLPETTDRLLLSWDALDGQIVLGWWESGAVLEKARQLPGPWESLTNQSPVVVAPQPSDPHEFFRLRLP